MRKLLFFLVAAISINGAHATNDSAYRCKSNTGKTTIQSWPCNETAPKIVDKTQRPNYPKIVDCGFKQGLTNILASLIGESKTQKDCTKIANP